MIKRRKWFDFHSWVGLNLSVLMTFVLVTGTLATISSEIDWLANPAMRVDRSTALAPLDWPALIEQARTGFPDATIGLISAPKAPWLAVEVTALGASGEPFRIFLHPQTNVIQGTGNWKNWQRFFRESHRNLMLNRIFPTTMVGITIVGLLAIPLFISFVSGFFVYRKWWRGFFKFPKEKESRGQSAIKGKRRFWGNLHRLLGVWSLWFILLMALTGSWYLLEKWGLAANITPVVSEKLQPKDDSGSSARATLSKARLAAMAGSVRALYPELKVTSIRLPFLGNDLVIFQGNGHAVLVRERANQVAFSAATGEHIATRKGEDLGIHSRISEAADPLHFGTFGNTPTRYIWFVFGVMLSVLSGSGAYLYGLRIIRSSADTRILSRTYWVATWRGIGHLRWPTVGAVAVCLWLAATEFVG